MSVDSIEITQYLPENKENYIIKKFDCGHEAINHYLKNSLRQNIEKKMSQAYIIVVPEEKKDRIIGYYNIMAFSIKKAELTTPPAGAVKEIPVMRLVMLGVDKEFQGSGLGKQLLRHAFILTKRLSEQAGIAGLYLDAENGRHDFYRQFGFIGIKEANEHNILPMFLHINSIP